MQLNWTFSEEFPIDIACTINLHNESAIVIEEALN